jgi:hypothetical protein
MEQVWRVSEPWTLKPAVSTVPQIRNVLCFGCLYTDADIERIYLMPQEAIADTEVMRGIPADAQIIMGPELDKLLTMFQGNWYVGTPPPPAPPHS